MIGGVPLGFCYKAINTLDSMVGYRNAKYLHLGRASAKLDDAANWLPSRICGLLLTVSAFLLRLDGKNAWRIFRRDSGAGPGVAVLSQGYKRCGACKRSAIRCC
jgi:adenosylcobinamide-phosphate synthase